MLEESQRQKPGRKPVDDKKIPLTIYINESVISDLGNGMFITGKDKAKAIARAAVYEFHVKQNSK